MLKTDILIIGSGLAGVIAAITAADLGKNVLVITKTDGVLGGSSVYAQGGIIYKSVDDSPEMLFNDIVNAGAGHC